MSAELLAPSVSRRLISSISVSPTTLKPGRTRARRCKSSRAGSEEVRKHYGALKALCASRRPKAALPGRATNVRPG